jgi:hypothetical protein
MVIDAVVVVAPTRKKEERVFHSGSVILHFPLPLCAGNENLRDHLLVFANSYDPSLATRATALPPIPEFNGPLPKHAD